MDLNTNTKIWPRGTREWKLEAVSPCILMDITGVGWGGVGWVEVGGGVTEGGEWVVV